ncbi:hypothetical protein ACFC0D_32700 [Streptomyces sp. NPDC056222]|uniref:hypothetical protein n=1 Tax=Streptomyces sp. NPDC056222 TaxID=3345749 RepID=UPI0035DB3A90
MHGHAPMTPPRPGPSAGVIAVRVIICVLVVLSFGFFAWIGMLRIAIMRRTARDWVLFWGQLVLNIACLSTLEQRLADHWISDVGMAGLLVQMAAVTAYYLVVDIRHHQKPVMPAVPVTPVGPYAGGYGYGYPATAATAPQPPYAAPQSYATPQPYASPQQYAAPQPHASQPNAPQAMPPTDHPTPPRTDQVRAELDELSNLLRKEEGK